MTEGSPEEMRKAFDDAYQRQLAEGASEQRQLAEWASESEESIRSFEVFRCELPPLPPHLEDEKIRLLRRYAQEERAFKERVQPILDRLSEIEGMRHYRPVLIPGKMERADGRRKEDD